MNRAEFVERLIAAVLAAGRVDTNKALTLAESAVAIAGKLRRRSVLGTSLRAKANALYFAGKNQESIEFHTKALEIFEALGNEEEIGRTLTASLQPLILLGEYERALPAAERAREIFTRLGDKRRLARLENNVGNIYHRQDRFEEALACYERAYEQFLPYGDSEELVVALSNMSMCLISLNDFPRALATYERARAFCGEDKLPLLRGQADYNIAYLYYLRGEYSRGIEMLHAARRRCEAIGDEYHVALCHLDLAEIYLELNLSAEAREMAHEGFLRFQKLGMGYEEAKCQCYEALAYSQLGKAVRSIEVFGESRAKFVREKNLVWPWLIDLYQSIVLFNEGRLFESRRLCARAAEFFDHSFLASKAVVCHLLLARIALRTGDATVASEESERALARLGQLEAPVLHYQAHFMMGEVQRTLQDFFAAYDSYQKAREALEALRSSLRGEELKIAFMKNRLEVYESLVDLCLSDPSRKDSAEESFGYIEMAKSRSLAELLMHHGPAPATREEGQSDLVRRIREMREELNWYYRRIEIEQLRAEEPSKERIEKLQKEAYEHENDLLRALREMPRPEEEGGGVAAPVPLDKIRNSLPPDAALIEYFSLREQFIAAVLTRKTLEIVPITPISRATNLVRMLRFQISKFRLGAEYVRTFEKNLLEATQSHLKDLYNELFLPLREKVGGARHVIIVPHGVLHYLPFHALFDGADYLADLFTFSYAPSAGVFALCQGKNSKAAGGPLILGVPDERAPLIAQEVASIAAVLPGAELVVGAEAGEAALRREGMHSRIIHIATHGNFRQDNPMFSGIRIGSSYLNLYDLYQLKLEAKLVTLSGCATGLNVVAAGDELLGLIRGLLYAGAESLLLTLWDVNDRSTAEFMTAFYASVSRGDSKTAALRNATQQLRDAYPHPYHWAPFLLIGKTLG
ncbi:MAG TPA: CHAT domain-containing tetratricopeptide repeat protein [Candidatus Acidoferrum sp.]|nr:CHAT domain-containing tetratricopeptide repeat protein [Candidatus Acidoferrum sp.]